MRRRLWLAALLGCSACAMASGYDPKRYPPPPEPDPETQALPFEPGGTIPDKRRPPAPRPPPPEPPAAPEAVDAAPADASAPDAKPGRRADAAPDAR